MNAKDIETEADVQLLVDSFYQKVLTDPLIGFLFTEVVALSWQKHLPIMYSFWSSLLLGTHTYAGNPMRIHIELDKKSALSAQHFNRWLELWAATVNELFSGNIATDAIHRANTIALMMQKKIAQNHPTSGIG